MKLAKNLSVALALLIAGPAHAQDIVGSYVAYIGRDDLYNSSGARLTEPWQILRQDRANFHRYGISQRGDEWDSFFGSIENRAIMERMVMNGSIDRQAAQNLVRGDATVFVRIYGRGSRGDSVQVTVVR
jgi:hypothetical protein